MQVSTTCKEKASCLVGILAAQLAGWWAADKPDHQAEVPAQKAGHIREGLGELRSRIGTAHWELCEAIHLLFPLSKYFLSTYYVLETVLGPEDPTYQNKMDKVLTPLELTILMR